jgi:hypothetical protein
LVCSSQSGIGDPIHILTNDHRETEQGKNIPAWNPEWYGLTNEGMKWLEKEGCTWTKVCAEPGDLLLWDSRTPHYNLSSTTDQSRFCVYTCYMPVTEASEEELARKKVAFEGWFGTTHCKSCFPPKNRKNH